MSTFLSLKTDIANWLKRDDLAPIIPTFVLLAEDDIARGVQSAKYRRTETRIRVRDMIRRARAAGDDSRYLALPLNYLEMRRLEMWPDSDRRYSLIQVTPENLQVLSLKNTSASSYNSPQRYCIHREIEFDAPLGTDGEVEMVYYEKYARLAADTDTNWLLQNAYDLYLYGALRHAEPYLRNDERIKVWFDSYVDAALSLMDSEKASRVNQGEARVYISGSTP